MNKICLLMMSVREYIAESTSTTDRDEKLVSFGKAMGIIEAVMIMSEEETEYPHWHAGDTE